ncbi:MAG: cytochrome c biogenesis protein CcdA, partial [Pseudomonadota bacterium]
MNVGAKLRWSMVAIALGLAGLAPASVLAADSASAWAINDHARVRLLAAAQAVGTAETLRLGLQFRLDPGWKIYWRSPGDAGYPPRPDWAGSRNLAGASLRWPAPERFELFGLDTFGYGGEVVLPIEARLERPGEMLALMLALDYLVCEKICIPVTDRLALALPAGRAAPSPHAHLIARFNARVPVPDLGSESAGLSIERGEWVGGAAPQLVVVARAGTPFAAPDVFVEGAPGWTFGRPATSFAEGGRRAVLRLPARADGRAPAADLLDASVTLTLVDGTRALERRLALERGSAPSAVAGEFLAILALAILGGLILNLMPCVLPVLSLKLLGVIRHGGSERAAVRASFLASAAGILTAFLALALGMVALRGAGHAIGWGIQFQEPMFLVFMGLLLTLFAANLWGWFDIHLPGFVAEALESYVPAGGAHADRAGAFATGAFATLLATPCSAPFLGTAAGFALARGPVEIFAVFAALGFGLALPYLALAAFPGAAAWLPRPGAWMIRLRQFLGLALAATALWLLSVLAAQVGTGAAVVVAVLLAAALAALWAAGRLAPERRRLALIGLVGLAALAFAAPGRLAETGPVAAPKDGAVVAWRPFARSEIDALVRSG